MAYQEPCCIDKNLPLALRDNKGMLFFQTSGDVLLGHLLKSVSYMAGDSHVLVISVPEVDINFMRILKHYMDRGWTKALCLLTQSAQDNLVTEELGPHIDKVQYASDPLILDGLLAIVGAEKAVVIQGAILSKKDFSLCHYAAWTGSDKAVLQQAIDPLIAKLKTKARIDHKENPDVAMVLNREFL